MKTVNRIRIAIVASAALSLAAMSSSAWAQPEPWQYCSDLAWYNCSWVNGQPTMVTEECWTAEYDACMAGFGTLAANARLVGDRRYEVQPA